MKKFILILYVLLSHQISLGQEKISKSEKLNALFEHCYENKLFNGNVLIVSEGDTLLKKSYGYRDFTSKDVLKSDDPFLLASVSKQFTAMAIVQLHSEGKLNYDDLVVNHLQEFPYSNVTIRHLLTHSSGLKEYTSLVNSNIERFEKRFKANGEVFDNHSVFKLFKNNKISLDFQPGTNFSYSNTGYVYLALVIEKLSGMKLEEYFQTKIFSPLGLKNTYLKKFGNLDNTLNGLEAYEENLLNEKIKVKKVPEFFRTLGDGGIYSTSEDLLKWFQALDNGILISQKAQKEAYEAYSVNDKDFPYGFGWFVRKHPINGNHILTHSGKFRGFVNSVFRDLDNGYISIVLSNNSHSINGQINNAIVRILYDQPFQYPKIPASNILMKELLLNGMVSVHSLYEKYKDDVHYDFSEKSINKMGYILLSGNKVTEARDVFEWNSKLFPNSSNVYDSLGEAQFNLGRLKEAQLSYEKSLTLNKENENARLMLKKIEQKGL